MNQIQIQDKKTKYDRAIQKGLFITRTKRVKHSDANRKIWLVGSGNPKRLSVSTPLSGMSN